MNFGYVKYKEITFPVRNCEFSDGKSTINRRIGSEGVILEDDAFNLLFWGNYCNVDCEED